MRAYTSPDPVCHVQTLRAPIVNANGVDATAEPSWPERHVGRAEEGRALREVLVLGREPAAALTGVAAAASAPASAVVLACACEGMGRTADVRGTRLTRAPTQRPCAAKRGARAARRRADALTIPNTHTRAAYADGVRPPAHAARAAAPTSLALISSTSRAGAARRCPSLTRPSPTLACAARLTLRLRLRALC